MTLFVHFFLFAASVAFTVVNAVLYVTHGHHWWSLAAAIWCGFFTFWNLAMAVKS